MTLSRRVACTLLAATCTAAAWAAASSSGLASGVGAVAAAATAPLHFTLEWSTTALPDVGKPIAESSPNVATLTGGRAVVVGDRAGDVYAYYLTGAGTGKPAPVPGWPAQIGVPVTSTPSAEPLGGSAQDSVFVGAGNAADPTQGGYYGLGPGGNLLWHTSVIDPGTDTEPAHGVQASLSVGALAGSGPDVVGGSLDQEEYALEAATGATLAGWPFFTSDSVFSTAALADLYGTGRTEIVEGGDQTAGFGLGQEYTQGGHIRILGSDGNLVCDYVTDQTVDSSPAVGGFLAGGATGIVVGTGKYFSGASETDTVIALDNRCEVQWTAKLNGFTTSSPALADLDGNGEMDVVEGVRKPTGGGAVWALTGSTGGTLWHTTVPDEVLGSVVTFTVPSPTGGDHQDVLVPTFPTKAGQAATGIELLDGATGTIIASFAQTIGFQSSPLVTDDANGTIGVTVAGYGGPGDQGFIMHYEIPGSNGALAVGNGSWPEFHRDPQLTGNADGTADPGSEPACTVPSAVFSGYDEVAADGGIFSFGSAPFCGSTGGMTLNAPVVGMAMAPGTGGYWLVAADGGVFAYGGAKFYGSMGGKPLNKPIVGMAATPDGKGYWLVASDGGIFAFGDAKFYGSMGGKPLNKPIVGMAPTPDGKGYRLVAADGGIFAFGDAQFFGSMGGNPLNKPIVGMAVDPATAGYWLVAADGGIFSFNAPFYGSMGGQPLDKPIVGMSATPSGAGYRFTAADGGIFSFGDAKFYGSMGGKPLNKPVVGMAST